MKTKLIQAQFQLNSEKLWVAREVECLRTLRDFAIKPSAELCILNSSSFIKIL